MTPEQQAQYQRALERLDRYARMLDSRFRIPFTSIRFGIEPLVGLIPGVGDAAGFAMSFYLISEAARLGAGPKIIGKMIGNLAVDSVVGLVPIAGDAFDLVWRANDRNMSLLRGHIEQVLEPPKPRQAWFAKALWVLLGAMVAGFVVLLVIAL
jgi:hypothetical protein